jgi:hypothetical protein
MLGNPLALIRSVVTIFGDWAVEMCAGNFKVYTSFEKKILWRREKQMKCCRHSLGYGISLTFSLLFLKFQDNFFEGFLLFLFLYFLI